MNSQYHEQVRLLLSVLPIVAKYKCFALHGGTAINLFVRNMPRLSVDIDLTYLTFENRSQALQNIQQALLSIQDNIIKTVSNVKVVPNLEAGKLLISQYKVQIKLEVNLINRGVVGSVNNLMLCEKAQDTFDAFCEVPTVPLEQLWGGKICAALDRQHPRDLFDCKYLLEKELNLSNLKMGLLLTLLSSSRPIDELLAPNLLDQKQVLESQFNGMTNEPFSYQQYQTCRDSVIELVNNNITKKEKDFIWSFHNLRPDWATYNLSEFPAIKWKLKNLKNLKEQNPIKYKKQVSNVEQML